MNGDKAERARIIGEAALGMAYLEDYETIKHLTHREIDQMTALCHRVLVNLDRWRAVRRAQSGKP